MRKSILLFFISTMIGASAFAQNQKFIDAMTKTLTEMDTIHTPEQFLAVSNKLERIAMAEKKEWLPYYYSALARVTSQYMVREYSKTDEVLDVAQRHIDIADSLSPKNSEIYVVKAMIAAARIMVDFAGRGQTYGMMSMGFLSEAIQLNPDNPRAYYVIGQSLFYTPAAFGGGVEPACQQFTKSKEKYLIFKPESSIHPNWGQDQLDQQMKQCGSSAPPVEKE